MAKKPPAKLPRGPGRPSSFDSGKALAICDRIARGSSARSACQAEGVDERTFLDWVRRDEGGISAQYARAREEQIEWLADELIKIADDSSRDRRENDKGEEVSDAAAVQRSRLKIETRKWLLAKMRPKQYGDRVEVTGENGGPVSQAVVVLPPEATLEGWIAQHAKKEKA